MMKRKNKIEYIKMKLKSFSTIYDDKNAQQKLNTLTDSKLAIMSDKDIEDLYNEIQFFNLMYNSAISC